MAITTAQRRQIEAIANDVDTERPGLRARDLEAWMRIVAWRCFQLDRRVGRKSAGHGRPVSKDTLGVLEPEIGPGHFSAVSIARDDPAGQNPRRWLEFGLVGSDQEWLEPTRPQDEPVPADPPAPPTPPAPPAPPTAEPVPDDLMASMGELIDGRTLTNHELRRMAEALELIAPMLVAIARHFGVK